MKTILVTNNKLDYPVLHSQLLAVYKEIRVNSEKVLYCSDTDLDRFEEYRLVNFSVSKIAVLNYLWYIFSLRKMIRSSERDDLFHIRGFVGGIVFFIAMLLAFKTPNYIYDPRGFFLQEKSEVNSWISKLRWAFAAAEKKLISHSIRTIVTTEKFKDILASEYGMPEKYLVNYNCSNLSTADRDFSIREMNEINVVYLGAVNYWHDIDEIARLLLHLRSSLQEKYLRLYFLTAPKNQAAVKAKLNSIGFDELIIDSVPYSSVEKTLNEMHIGISVVKPTTSSVIASPIKIADYLKAGLVIVCNEGIGDFDQHYLKEKSALLYKFGTPDFTAEDLYSVRSHQNAELINRVSSQTVANQISHVLNTEMSVSPKLTSEVTHQG